MLLGTRWLLVPSRQPGVHADDIHAAIIDTPDIEVITPAGSERRKASAITVNDALKLKVQRSFFPMFFSEGAAGSEFPAFGGFSLNGSTYFRYKWII